MSLAPTCPCCGHAVDGRCQRCGGSLRHLDGRHPTTPGRRNAVVDLWCGWVDVVQSPFALLHGREYIGALRMPVAANAIATTLLAAFAWLVLSPAFATCFAEPWWLFEGLRAAHADTGPALWLLTVWLMLGPSVLDASVGVLHEPLRLATERTMLGPGEPPGPPLALLRLRERARILGIAAAATPFLMFVALVPWIGLPVVALAGATTAAVVWFEPPMAARGLDLRARLRQLWRNRWRALGAGAGIQLAAAVPFVNLLALTAVATVAATAAYLQFDKSAGADSTRGTTHGPG